MASSGEDVCGGAEGRPRNGAASSRDSPPRRQSLAAVLAAAQDATERKLILAGASLRRIVFLLRTLHYHLSWQWSLKRGGFSRASDDVDDDSDDSDDEKGDDDDDEKGDDEDDEKGDDDDDDDDDWEPPFPSDLVEVEGYGEGDVVDNPEMDRNHPASWKRRLLRISFYRKVFGPKTLVPFLMERISPRQLAMLAEDGLGLMVRSVRFDSEDSESEDEEDGGGAARPL